MNSLRDMDLRNGYEGLTDPVRDALTEPDLDTIFTLFPRPAGDPAADPDLLERAIAGIRTDPVVDTGHALLDRSILTGLALIDLIFDGDHPHYGVKIYSRPEHDAFPPTIIAVVGALSAWGMHGRACELLTYWLRMFVRDDGTIDYYGPSVSEYGQLLHTIALLAERAGTDGWFDGVYDRVQALGGYLLGIAEEAINAGDLIAGSPEADERENIARYFHNNAWAVTGLRRWLTLPGSDQRASDTADRLADLTLAAINDTWPDDPADWWLSPQVEPAERPSSMTGTRLASYTNYRYWPELLSSGILPEKTANRVVDARLNGGGQFCGMTRFQDHFDDWPLADYLYGLWSLGRKNDFLLSLYGHIAYHQAEGHLAAFEQVTFPPGREFMAMCLPCQLVAARAGRLLI